MALADNVFDLRGDPLQIINPFDSGFSAFTLRAGDDQLGGDRGFTAWWVPLKVDCDVVDLFGLHGVHSPDGEGWVLHDEGEVCCIQEDVLEGDDDVASGSD